MFSVRIKNHCQLPSSLQFRGSQDLATQISSVLGIALFVIAIVPFDQQPNRRSTAMGVT